MFGREVSGLRPALPSSTTGMSGQHSTDLMRRTTYLLRDAQPNYGRAGRHVLGRADAISRIRASRPRETLPAYRPWPDRTQATAHTPAVHAPRRYADILIRDVSCAPRAALRSGYWQGA